MTSDRIAIFLPSLHGGGAERVMVTLANAFAERGYSVDLVLASKQGVFLKDVSYRVRIINLNAERSIKSLLPLIRYLRRERPSSLLSAMTHANTVAILAHLFTNTSTRVVISERNTISEECNRAGGLMARINFWLVPLLYLRADAICTVSKAASADLAHFAHLPLEKIQTIYNPFDLNWINSQATERLMHPWFAAEELPVILAAGRLTEQKDFLLLIQAFAKVKKTHPARLLILGEGELRLAIQAEIHRHGLSKNDVGMPGFVANPYAFMARCDVFVLSSRWEGLPGVLIQSMACGAPVVSTDCKSGPSEILEGGKWGKLTPVGDVKALALAINQVLDTPKAELPDVKIRARDFEQHRAVDAYLKILGLTAHSS